MELIINIMLLIALFLVVLLLLSVFAMVILLIIEDIIEFRHGQNFYFKNWRYRK